MSKEIALSRSEQLRKHIETDREFMARCTCPMCVRARRSLADLLDAVQTAYVRFEFLPLAPGANHEPPSTERKALDEILAFLKAAHRTASNNGHPPGHSF